MNTSGPGTAKEKTPFLFELDEFLPYRLSLLTNTVSAGIARSYRDQHEISVIEWRIMAVLGRYPGLTASEIGERTAMDKVAISRAVKRLVERGLLERLTDPQDRRRMHLQLSPGYGRKMLEEIIPLAQHYETQLLAALPGSEQKALARILEKLQSKAKTLNL
jgi:DNA-binding MarR family transcriptional regulator